MSKFYHINKTGINNNDFLGTTSFEFDELPA